MKSLAVVVLMSSACESSPPSEPAPEPSGTATVEAKAAAATASAIDEPEEPVAQSGGIGTGRSGESGNLLELLAPVEVQVTRMRGARGLVNELRQAGFRASIYDDELDPDAQNTHRAHRAIWIGCEVPVPAIVAAMRIANDRWPHLEYAELSCDGDSEPPVEIHEQLYLGGATSTARESGLQRWSAQDFGAVRPGMSRDELFELVRSRYRRKR